ncbi:MAG: type IV pilus secretin PilQ [Thermoanaerobaculia bacterium]|nr:type IV pilus secretin PilQ [Thermoanaerobaculia bacterium]
MTEGMSMTTMLMGSRNSKGTADFVSSGGGSMRRNRRGVASRFAALALIVPVFGGCASRTDRVVAGNPSATGAAPATLTGATLLTDGETPRLLLTGNGPLAPTLYNREGSTKVVIDVANAVMSPGLEPPRADGVILSRLDMKSFTEMGKPHIQFELTGRAPIEPAITSDFGSPAMAIALGRAKPAAETPAAATTLASVEPARVPEPAPVETPVKVEDVPSPVAPAEPPAVADAAPVPVRHAALGHAATRLSAVGVQTIDGKLVATLAGNGSFAYETFALENPPRYVVDLPGVLLATTRRSQDVRHAAVNRVRVSQFKGGSEPVTRVVFDLASPAEPAAKSSTSGLALSFESAATIVAKAHATEPAALPAPAPVTSAAAAEVSPEKPAEPKPGLVRAAPEMVAAASPVPAAGSYEKHEVDEPKEPVVREGRAVDVTTSPAAPTMSAPPPPPAVAASPAAPPAPQADAPRLVQASPEFHQVKAPPPVPAAPVKAAAAVEPRRRRAPTAEDKALIEAAEALLVQQDGSSRPREIANPYEARTLGSGDKQYTGEPITLNLKDADIKDTLQRFSELTQLNIVLDPDVRGTVTVSLQDIPWDQALELILKINQLGYVLEGNIMRIASTSKLTQEENSRLQFIQAQDKNRPLRTVLQKISYGNAQEMAATARKVMSARGDIFIDTRSNTLVIKELPDYLPTVLDLIKNLDIASPQVMIEARIIEANRTFSNEIGIVWGFSGVSNAAHGNTTGLVFPNSGSVAGNVSLPSGAPQVLSLRLADVLNTFSLDAAIRAAESRGLVKVVSTPKVQTQTGELASIQSGFQIPVQTTVNNTTSVLYINATLRLDVTPQITNEGTVIMDVTIQKREPAVGINIAGGQNIPLTTRDAKTRLMVRDGGTAVIGGIFKITTNDGQSMIPGLWKIPILGNLFRSRTQTESTDELMIFITPRIIR